MSIPKVGFNHAKSKQDEFELVELESLYTERLVEHSQRPHRVTFFNLICIEEGTGTHQVDFKYYPYTKGSFLFVQRDQVHAFDFSQRPKGKMFLFTQAFLDQVQANMRLPGYTPTHLNREHTPLILPDAHHAPRCQRLLQEIGLEMTREEPDRLFVMHLFSALSLILQRLQSTTFHHTLNTEQNAKLSGFMSLLERNFSVTRDATWYAQQLCITYKTLNQICKRATGLPVKQLIDAFTVVEAKRRLMINRPTTQQLAYELGFDDASNFVKYFKKHTNHTPTSFLTQYS